MQIFELNDIISSIHQRALSLSISKDFADQQDGKINLVNHQGSEQENRRRELLSVEREAQQEKIVAAYGEKHFRNQVTDTFYEQVRNQVNKEFDNKTHLYHNILCIEDAAPAILELLSLRATSINKIQPLSSSLLWLATDLISLVNKPQYRKRADVQVNDAKLALSYIGLDNLKLVMPTFILKHWLPNSTAPYGLMKRKLWNDSLSVALAARVLAKDKKLDWYTAFTTGMLSNIGQLAVTRCFLNTYNDMYKDALHQAVEDKDKLLHNVLVKIDNSPGLLLEQLTLRSSKLSADLIELMNFTRLPITGAMFDLAYSENVDEMSPIAQVVAKAKVYVNYRSLSNANLINDDEMSLLFETVKLSEKEISLLNKSDIDHIKLKFN
ncbi:HDOD domain-containing protein [Candidatus Colwellia aromaticivorans]|uniref:HDOD domain-containing protein n=1 Tax=Candidatus Colwellia aromaticivorans TaxID=2267621 RepID=UPI000DF2B8B2|nr:HDOD domain-containing protein [Candidatus Colwellia aromaticivorans]